VARRSLAEGEVLLCVVEAGAKLRGEDRDALAELAAFKRPLAVAINKIDKVRREALLPVADEIQRMAPEAEIVPISALSGENVDELLRVLKPMLPPSEALMPGEEYTDQTERMLAEEIVREKIFIAMRQEIPFSTAVTVEQFSDEPERSLSRIAALVIVERDSHKGMIIGAGGRMLKEIGTQARLELEQMLGRRIFLELRVKVEKGWTADPRKLKELGF
jgi:GTPase